MGGDDFSYIELLTPEVERKIRKNPLLNIDTFIIPSPYIRDADIEKDYSHSYIWREEGEILGYLLVYSDRKRENFLIYKLVTSPFGRGMGIGTAFIEHLARNIHESSTIYLYIWDKQNDTVEFFQNKGFGLGETIVYRNLVYYHMSASGKQIIENGKGESAGGPNVIEEIGKTRHDARKTVRLLSNMVEMLSAENCAKIVEDINRETTTLLNMLNSFRDSMKLIHEVNLKELILDRILPYITASSVQCEVNIHLDAESPMVLGYYVNIGRALVNMVSNALDAIEESGRKGRIGISITEEAETVVLSLSDNGTGIPANLLERDAAGYPGFVGKTTKGHRTGEGLGTRQIFSTFGPQNIEVRSAVGEGTAWTVRLPRSTVTLDRMYVRLERRYNESLKLSEKLNITSATARSEVISWIWQLRKMEILMFDLILQFSNYQNIRSIFRLILQYLNEEGLEQRLGKEIAGYRVDYEPIRKWLFDLTVSIRRRRDHIFSNIDVAAYRGALFKSYGQAVDNIMIFTLDPETGAFFATDRKLAEHLDFVHYLGKPKEELLRGEFRGDVNNESRPITLGVWSVDSEEDLKEKLRLIRRGAGKLLEIGIHAQKKLSLYQTTYIRGTLDIDSYRSSTVGEFASLGDEDLFSFVRQTDEELDGYLLGRE